MGDAVQLKRNEEVCKRLEVSQELIEKSAFDTINQQDKISQMMNYSVTYVTDLLTKFQQEGMDLEAALMEEIVQMYHCMIEEQCVLSEVLHSMESEIACHRDAIELAEELLLKQ